MRALLTFDDGPGDASEALLDLLAEHGVRAAFFLLGKRVEQHPETVARIAREGHALGNHSWDHPDLTTLDREAVRDQLERTSDAIAAAAGRPPELFRPPFGRSSMMVDEIAVSLGLRKVMWQVATNDTTGPDAVAISQSILSAHDGDVVLLHDGGSGRERTVEAVRLALSGSWAAPAPAAPANGQLDALQVNETQVVHETIDGETIIIHMGSGTYYSIDGAGSQAWELLASGVSANDVVERMQERYPDHRAAVADDLRDLFAELLREGALAGGAAVLGDTAANGADVHLADPQGAWLRPLLHRYTDMQEFMLVDPLHDVDAAAGWPHAKAG